MRIVLLLRGTFGRHCGLVGVRDVITEGDHYDRFQDSLY
jgi:hypothetical protein